MPAALTVIPSRQDTEALFESDDALLAGGSFVSQVRLVAGYFAVDFLAISNTTFSVLVEEACSRTGPFIQAATYPSAASGTVQQVCMRHLPCGPYARVTVTNLGGAQTFLSFCGTGLPQP